MVLTSDRQKINLGLSIKFEAKSMKVINYSRKDGRSWEYSQKALDLIMEYKVRNSLAQFSFVLKVVPFFRKCFLMSSGQLRGAEMVIVYSL
jgi:hypothetical protein